MSDLSIAIIFALLTAAAQPFMSLVVHYCATSRSLLAACSGLSAVVIKVRQLDHDQLPCHHASSILRHHIVPRDMWEFRLALPPAVLRLRRSVAH